MKNNWFEVDKDGLSRIMSRRGKALVLYELLQNAWDTNTSKVEVALSPLPNRPGCHLSVIDDDPDGFRSLEHAYKLFAESEKKNDPTKRGRFNLGEKLVLSLCHEAEVISTTGSIRFHEDGTRTAGRTKRQSGSEFRASIKMTRDEYQEICEAITKVIKPVHIRTLFNDKEIPEKVKLAEFQVSLPTEISDEEGNIRRVMRKTSIEVYDVQSNESACIYELGIPIVETGDTYHVNVMQKVPLNMDRDNVSPAYLKAVRVAVLNALHDRIPDEEVTKDWVVSASSDRNCSDDAIRTVMDKKFGPNRVSFDLSDLEANNRSVAKGYVVVHGRMLSPGQWELARRAGVIEPAGQKFPTPKPYSTDPDAKPVKKLREDELTEDMKRVRAFAIWTHERILDSPLIVTFVYTNNPFGAAYGEDFVTKFLDFNVKVLGDKFFSGSRNRIFDLLIHEFAHFVEGNHLSEDYALALSSIGGKLAELALIEPERFLEVGSSTEDLSGSFRKK